MTQAQAIVFDAPRTLSVQTLELKAFEAGDLEAVVVPHPLHQRVDRGARGQGLGHEDLASFVVFARNDRVRIDFIDRERRLGRHLQVHDVMDVGARGGRQAALAAQRAILRKKVNNAT